MAVAPQRRGRATGSAARAATSASPGARRAPAAGWHALQLVEALGVPTGAGRRRVGATRPEVRCAAGSRVVAAWAMLLSGPGANQGHCSCLLRVRVCWGAVWRGARVVWFECSASWVPRRLQWLRVVMGSCQAHGTVGF